MNGVLIRGAEIPGVGIVDVRCAGSRISAMASSLKPMSGEQLIDAGGGALVPGLNDHHIHLYATAAARDSLDCSPSACADASALAQRLRTMPGSDWIRGYGFHDSVCPGLDRAWLDRVEPQRPVRLQHQSGKLWLLNSAALAALGVDAADPQPVGVERRPDGSLSGRLFDLDGWLRARLGSQRPSLRQLSAELAGYGITGVTDTGADNDANSLQAIADVVAAGEFRQRVQLMGNEQLDELLGDQPGNLPAGVSVGALKIYLREVDLPPLDQLTARIRRAHDRGRNIAVHCVTRTELVYLLSALDDAGVLAGDRVEHAALTDDASLLELARLGVTVVTQPHFIAERGDRYRADVEPDDIAILYRARGFVDAGVSLAAGSDAPYGATDPWRSMRAATERRTGSGKLIGECERLGAFDAFSLYCGTLEQPAAGYRPLTVGDRADLCLLAKPWQQVLDALDSALVRMTVCGGEIIHDAA